MAAVKYRATVADDSAWARSRRPKCCKLAINSRLRQAVAGKLRLDWLREQIAGWVKRTHREDEYNQVSHETIYRSLFVQARGVLNNRRSDESSDSAIMHIWLHKQVMAKLAANGGKLPADLHHA